MTCMRQETHTDDAALYQCGKCGEHKPASEFHRNKARKTGLQFKCKACCKEASAQRYREDADYRERMHARAKQWREANPDRVAQLEEKYYSAEREQRRIAREQRKQEREQKRREIAENGIYRCTKCGEDKPADGFHKNKQAWNGVQAWCKECLGGMIKRRYRDDLEFRDRIKASAARQWTDAEKRAAKQQRMSAYVESNRESINARTRQRYRENPLPRLASGELRRARKEQATIVPFTDQQLQQRWDYYGGKCWMCGETATCTDHVKPLAKGGAHALANLRPACRPCNARKKDQWPYRSGIEF